MKNYYRFCDYCIEEIPPERHGNTNYCSDECQQAAASERGKEYYAASVFARKLN